MKKITGEALSAMDGRNGGRICIAYKGKVYDLSASDKWLNGQHMGRHKAGRLIVSEIEHAPHGPEVLEKFPVVGDLLEEPAYVVEPSLKNKLKRFEWPIRHGHPMTVHYPLALIMAASLFVLLYMLTGYKNFENTSYYLMVLAFIASPVAVTTGLVTWWYSYNCDLSRIIKRKMLLSAVLVLVTFIIVIWRTYSPSILTGGMSFGWLYLILALLVTPLVGLIGYYGGKLTFGS